MEISASRPKSRDRSNSKRRESRRESKRENPRQKIEMRLSSDPEQLDIFLKMSEKFEDFGKSYLEVKKEPTQNLH